MDLSEKYEILKKEVDSLQIQLGQSYTPWYKSSATIIAVSALIFSFGTTVVSYVNMHQQDIRENHREALTIIQRLSKLPIENFELMEKHKGSALGESLSGMINQENILMVSQAADMISKYPNTFNSYEFCSVAVALSASNVGGEVPWFFKTSLERADCSNDYCVPARGYGSYLYSKGDHKAGALYFQKALDVWKKYPEKNAYFKDSTDTQTFMFWAQAELMAKRFSVAEELIEKAGEQWTKLQPAPMTESLKNQINYTSNLIAQAKGTELQ